MEEKNLFEKLVELSPGMEIWWDSSPIIFDSWCKKMLATADPADREILKAQFSRMYNPDDPDSQLFRGVTTNPPLSLQAIEDDVPRWEKVAAGHIKDNPGIGVEELFWMNYKEIVRLGAEMYLPLFERSRYSEGFLSGQVDPRDAFDGEAMLRQAKDIAAVSPNVMVKVPGTKEGYDVIEELTARGIPTNNTLSFHMPQFVHCAQRVEKGLARARANGVDLTKWRSVITAMESRYGDLGGLREFGKEAGVEVSDQDVRWAELAIFKKACRYLKENRYQSKMLSCSLRIGPEVDGEMRVWHLEEKVGANIVMTCPPGYIDEIINFDNQSAIDFEANTIERDIPADVFDKLMKIEYFARAYDENGYTPEEFDSHPSLVKTAEQFAAATEKAVAFAEKCINAAQ
ncbi:MAG: transaldolase family protein [Desulfofustis sp.]|jgi:transaldolase